MTNLSMLVYICESMKLHAVAEYWQQVSCCPALGLFLSRPHLHMRTHSNRRQTIEATYAIESRHTHNI